MNEPAYYTQTTTNNIYGKLSINKAGGSNRRPDGRSSIIQDGKKHVSMRPSVEAVRLSLFGIWSTVVSRFKEWAMSLLVFNPSLRNLSPFYLVFCHCFKQWRIQERGPRGPPPPPLFRPKWGPEGQKHFFLETASPAPPPHPPQPYLPWDSTHVITTALRCRGP